MASSLEETLARFAKSRSLLKAVYESSQKHFSDLLAMQRDDFSRIGMTHEPSELFLSKPQLSHLHKVINSDPVIIVSGQINCGKTSLLNELLGGSYLPTSAIPCTARVVRVLYSKTNYIEVYDKEHRLIGERVNFSEKKVPEDKIKLDSSSRSEKNIVECFVEVGLNNELLRHGVQIMDIPGLSENNALDSLVKECLDGMLQLVIYVIDGKTSLRQSDSAFLYYLRNTAPRAEILYVCNKVEDDPVARQMDKFSGDEGIEEENLPDRAHLAFTKLKKAKLIPHDTKYEMNLKWYHGLSCRNIRKARLKKKSNEFVDNFVRFKEALLESFMRCVNTHLCDAVWSLHECQCRLFDFYISDKLGRLPKMDLLSHIQVILREESEFQDHLENKLENYWFDMVRKSLDTRKENETPTILEAVKDLEFQPITLDKGSGSNHVLTNCRLQVKDFVLMMIIQKFEIDLKFLEQCLDTETSNYRPNRPGTIAIGDSGVGSVLQHHLASIWDRQAMNFDISLLKEIWVAGLRQTVKIELKQRVEYLEMRFKGIYLNQKWKQDTAEDVLKSIRTESVTRHVLNALREKLRKDHQDFKVAMAQISRLCKLKEKEAVHNKNAIKAMVPSYSENLCVTEALANTLRFGAVELEEKIGEGTRCEVFHSPGYSKLDNIVVKRQKVSSEGPNKQFGPLYCYARIVNHNDHVVKVSKLVYDSDWQFCMILPKFDCDLYQLVSQMNINLGLEREIGICYEISKICDYMSKHGIRLNDLRLNNFLVRRMPDDTISVIYNLSKWQDLNVPYPNGELPFHFAPEVTTKCSDQSKSVARAGKTFDAYSLTVLLIQLTTHRLTKPDFGKDTLETLTEQEIVHRLCTGFLQIWDEKFSNEKSDLYNFGKLIIKKYIGTHPRDRCDILTLQNDLKSLVNSVRDVDSSSSLSSEESMHVVTEAGASSKLSSLPPDNNANQKLIQSAELEAHKTI